MNTKNLFCREITLDSKELIIPRTTYQRTLNEDRVRKIAAEFDERIANEPKVSSRGGCYYVFDGQHTIAARKFLNGGRDLPIRCKVFYGLSERDEALLFAQQTGASANLTAGARFRALVYGGDKEALAFQKVTEAVGLCVDCKQTRGVKRLAWMWPTLNSVSMTFSTRPVSRFILRIPHSVGCILMGWLPSGRKAFCFMRSSSSGVPSRSTVM